VTKLLGFIEAIFALPFLLAGALWEFVTRAFDAGRVLYRATLPDGE
jgi:hypothetical protein